MGFWCSTLNLCKSVAGTRPASCFDLFQRSRSSWGERMGPVHLAGSHQALSSLPYVAWCRQAAEVLLATRCPLLTQSGLSSLAGAFQVWWDEENRRSPRTSSRPSTQEAGSKPGARGPTWATLSLLKGKFPMTWWRIWLRSS